MPTRVLLPLFAVVLILVFVCLDACVSAGPTFGTRRDRPISRSIVGFVDKLLAKFKGGGKLNFLPGLLTLSGALLITWAALLLGLSGREAGDRGTSWPAAEVCSIAALEASMVTRTQNHNY